MSVCLLFIIKMNTLKTQVRVNHAESKNTITSRTSFLTCISAVPGIESGNAGSKPTLHRLAHYEYTLRIKEIPQVALVFTRSLYHVPLYSTHHNISSQSKCVIVLTRAPFQSQHDGLWHCSGLIQSRVRFNTACHIRFDSDGEILRGLIQICLNVVQVDSGEMMAVGTGNVYDNNNIINGKLYVDEFVFRKCLLKLTTWTFCSYHLSLLQLPYSSLQVLMSREIR